MKDEYSTWYAGKVNSAFSAGTPIEEVDVDLRLSKIKHAKWSVEANNKQTESKDILMTAWKSTGIPDTVEAVRK